ncbi:hypothetical protein [Methylobrevis pamukkalensis]|uniref:Uncharacterized protein n=1 Tax=Methylobrevis pamukkalensis TaxID=1439726 RepID=A0A1E3GXY4_9HYPH|nr:hypothetical protein [Methylobrevis pamukkalensis]ODN68903.1 hypothetical protein A6302_03802 [Methylobrevis pamukkalensis]
MTLIHRADAIGEIVAALSARFGAIDLLPVHPQAHKAAHRLIARGRLGSRAPLALLPGLVVHGEDGRYAAEVEAALRDGVGLEIGWR